MDSLNKALNAYICNMKNSNIVRYMYLVHGNYYGNILHLVWIFLTNMSFGSKKLSVSWQNKQCTSVSPSAINNALANKNSSITSYCQRSVVRQLTTVCDFEKSYISCIRLLLMLQYTLVMTLLVMKLKKKFKVLEFRKL